MVLLKNLQIFHLSILGKRQEKYVSRHSRREKRLFTQ